MSINSLKMVQYFFLGFVLGNDTHKGKILQRFPEKDWTDTPFIEGMELVKKSNEAIHFWDEDKSFHSFHFSFVNHRDGIFLYSKNNPSILCLY